jgi:hypothetical protein
MSVRDGDRTRRCLTGAILFRRISRQFCLQFPLSSVSAVEEANAWSDTLGIVHAGSTLDRCKGRYNLRKVNDLCTIGIRVVAASDILRFPNVPLRYRLETREI